MKLDTRLPGTDYYICSTSIPVTFHCNCAITSLSNVKTFINVTA